MFKKILILFSLLILSSALSIFAQLPTPVQISPPCGTEFHNYPRTFTMKWKPVPGAFFYEVQIDCFHCSQVGKWDSEVGTPHTLKVKSSSATFTFWGDNQGRWRVRAVGSLPTIHSDWSPWCDFSFKTDKKLPWPPDLIPYLYRCPETVRPGQDLGAGFEVWVKNYGDESAKDFFVDIVLRSDSSCPTPAPFAIYSPNYSNGVLLKGGREHISLVLSGLKGVKVKLNGTNTIPADTPPGIYYLCVVADAGNKVAEKNEGNNCACCQIKVVK